MKEFAAIAFWIGFSFCGCKTVYDDDVSTGSPSPSDLPSSGFSISATSIVSDTNKDGELSPGEMGQIQIRLENNKQNDLSGVTATLSTTNTAVTLSTSRVEFGDVPGRSSNCGTVPGTAHPHTCFGEYPSITVPTTVSVGTAIPFTLSITDDAGDAVKLAFSVTLVAIGQSFSITSSTIQSDSNGDGKVSPGENAQVQIELENSGTTDALGVTAAITTTYAGVTISGGPLEFGDIPSGSSNCGTALGSPNPHTCFGEFPSLAVPSSVQPGTSIPIALMITDKFGNKSSIIFNVAVVAIDQSFSIAQTSVQNDTNGDGSLSPGESANLQINLQNDGTSDGLAITGVLTTSYVGVTLSGSMLDFGDIRAGSSNCGTSAGSKNPHTCFGVFPAISISGTVPPGTTIPFSIALSDKYGNDFAATFGVIVGH